MRFPQSFRYSVAPRVLILAVFLFQTGCSVRSEAGRELHRLQGHWERDGSSGKTSITIKGNKLHFYERPDFWFETTFVLPENTDPRQLHATIENSAKPGDDIGQVVFAIYHIENGIFTLATDGGGDAPPATFADASSRYVLTKIQQGKNP